MINVKKYLNLKKKYFKGLKNIKSWIDLQNLVWFFKRSFKKISKKSQKNNHMDESLSKIP